MCLPQKFPSAFVKVILACALAVLAASAIAGPFTRLKQSLDHTNTDQEVIRAVKYSGSLAGQPDVADALKGDDETNSDTHKTAARLREIVNLEALDENTAGTGNLDSKAAAEVKKSPLYQDPGIEKKKNWLADALDRLKNIHLPKPKRDIGSGRDLSILGPIAVYLVWGILLAAVGFLLYIAFRHLNWQKSLKRKVQALVEDDEPDRTVDEWLVLADSHAAAGRFREAVRALYLACLLRFDEYDVARFDRGQTNWEHLARVETSPKLPPGLNFRTPTQRFDRVWYGYQTEGMPDVEHFREWYAQILHQLKEGNP